MANTFSEILAIEDDPQLLAFKSTSGVPYWSMIRNEFFRTILGDLVYQNSLSSMGEGNGPSRRALTTLVKSVMHNSILTRTTDSGICIFATGMKLRKRDGLWFNDLADHFVSVAPDRTCLVEQHFGWQWPFPRFSPKVILRSPLQVQLQIQGRLSNGSDARKEAARLLTFVTERARNILDWHVGPQRLQMLTDSLARRIASAPAAFKAYQQLLRSTNSRLLLIEEGCYGPSAIPILAARSLGMVTAEYQHGMISSSHDAYNFAPAVAENDRFRQTLPDHFLGYGRWWNEQINAPIRKHAIGDPKRQIKPRRVPAVPYILVLGDGIDTIATIKFCRELEPIAALAGHQVQFRPHPMERHFCFNQPDEFWSGIVLDREVDVLDSLNGASAAVAESSTTLYEAIGFSKKSIVWRTPKSKMNMPTHPFEEAVCPEELVRILTAGNHARVSETDIWEADWERNYREFVRSSGVVL